MRNKKTGRKSSYWLYGWHTVRMAIKNPSRLCVTLAYLKAHALEARALYDSIQRDKKNIILKECDSSFFMALFSEGQTHQGIALETAPLPSGVFEDLLVLSPGKKRLLVLDNVEDPRNIGAVMRSASIFGVDGVILAGKNTPPETASMAKAASGALERVTIFRPPNLARALDQLKNAEYWCIACHEKAEQMLPQVTFPEKTVLVFGAEGKGMRRLTAEKCDFSLAIPMHDAAIGSLNIANAVSVVLYASTL
jgi:23S rRNA (guanosine2251-2'-O)-methyltransferase